MFLTQNGFPAGSHTQFGAAGQFNGLASLYAQLAQSDEVLARIKANGGPLDGSFQAIPVSDSSQAPLPIVALFGKAATAPEAQTTLARGLAGFLAYVRSSQEAAGIPTKQRIDLQILNAPGQAILVEPRKKTLPIVVFLALFMATIATAFIFENKRRSAHGEEAGDAIQELRSARPADAVLDQRPSEPSQARSRLKPTPVPDPGTCPRAGVRRGAGRHARAPLGVGPPWISSTFCRGLRHDDHRLLSSRPGREPCSSSCRQSRVCLSRLPAF